MKHRHHHKWLRRILWGAAIVVGMTAIFLAIILWRYQRNHSGEKYRLGVSFSSKYIRELGLDEHQTLIALTDDLKIKHFRLMSYWDELEPQPGKLDFADLDWQMKQVANSGGKVSLAIGLRQPRYPECHNPSWASALSKAEQQRRLEDFMSAVIQRYRGHAELESYQLENEALNTAFGLCRDFSRQRLNEEFALVKRLDPNHPILVSVSNEFGLPIGSPRGDRVGFSIYHRVYDGHITHHYIEYPIPAAYHWLRAALIETILRRPVAIHELQAEPWGPAPTEQLSTEEQFKSMNPERLRGRVNYAKATHIHDLDLWGGEWWYWRLTKQNDPSMWETARAIFAENN